MSNDVSIILPAITLHLETGVVVNGVLAPVTVSADISQQAHLTVNAQLPWPPTLSASFRGLTADVSLPALTGHATGTIPNLMRAAITLPALQAGTIQGSVMGLMEAAVTLPALTISMRRGEDLGTLALPSLQGSASIVHNSTVAFAIALPALTAAGIGITNREAVLRANILLPALVGMSGAGVVTAVLPALQVSCTIVAGTAATRTGYAMNATNGAVTMYSGYPFRAFARAYDRYYGVGLDGGLYLMGGDTDAGAPISWEWLTGLSDLQSRALKGILALYVDGVAEPGIDFTVATERGTWVYAHQPHGDRTNHQTQRVPIGRRLRGANLAFGMKSTKGAYLELDSITPEIQIGDRNLG